MTESGEQYDLYDGRPPASDDDTSRVAADSVKHILSRLAMEVLRWIEAHDGATCWEVEQGLQMSHQTASARIRELALRGRIKDSGERRPTASGRAAVVWVSEE